MNDTLIIDFCMRHGSILHVEDSDGCEWGFDHLLCDEDCEVTYGYLVNPYTVQRMIASLN